METKDVTTDQARQALEAIANVPISISLEHWSVLSGTILSALAGADAALSVQKQLVEALRRIAALDPTLIPDDPAFFLRTAQGLANDALQAAKASS